jgi:hypothetical protein
MQQGRGGMGTHKHGISGYPTRSPRYKFMQTMADNRDRERFRPRRIKPQMFASVQEAFRRFMPK